MFKTTFFDVKGKGTKWILFHVKCSPRTVLLSLIVTHHQIALIALSLTLQKTIPIEIKMKLYQTYKCCLEATVKVLRIILLAVQIIELAVRVIHQLQGMLN